MIQYLKKPVTLILLLLVGSFITAQVDAKLGISKTRKREASKKIKQKLILRQNLGKKFNTLMSMTTVESVIPLLSSEFLDLIIKSPKNYSAIVIITDEEAQCKNCLEVSVEFDKVANSYLSTNFDSKRELFFIRLDYYDASVILHDKIKLNRSRPCILYFPTNSNNENIQEMESKKYFPTVDGISTWIRHVSGIIIRSSHKGNDEKDSFNSIIIALSLAFLVIQRWKTLKQFLAPEFIPIFLVGVVIAFMSGQVFNHVHGAPFALKGSSGVEVIYPNSYNQTVLESIVVFMLISTAVFGLIKVIDSKSIKEENPAIKNVESASVAVATANNADGLQDEEGWSGMSGNIGAFCYFGAVYGLLYMSHIKLSS